MNVAQRLPSVPSLSMILAAGTEGGKEFGRIVGLLLLNDARRNGLDFSLFDDASGDYEGLDSFSRKPKSKDAIGYQYKFFPSPLSDSHRAEIRASLENALVRSKKLKLVKWILVTPDDLKNSGRRKKGGDVEWFEGLVEKYKSRVEIQHIGHTKLQELFLQTSHLCLFYYPSLVVSGTARRKTIQELRNQYDDNMRKRYGRIEFVGMSVYKEEASRRIPLEQIYIPLSLVSERAPEEDDETPRVDPTNFLAPGARTVILGDPGSGKSTLLSFLALVGINAGLQARSGVNGDSRLTVIVTLRRYADELKINRNLSILEYVLHAAKADFSMDALSSSFYEFYLESGQAILLFDGLDELPGNEFKTLIRRRIESFNTSYPSNTLITTSRLVGYDSENRFDDSYAHFRIAKLCVHEIERFIADWYAARIEEQSERDRNSTDLIRVITHPDGEAIRALARNPLLLTIVALVHRIDAVLPDQRVVLYQKCTETLLNTWYKTKKRDEETVKGRVERHNRLRVEAIAYWMHRRSLEDQGRSVAPKKEILEFLTSYISANETIRETDDPAEDQAEAFLEFIKTSAGLLIEAGDQLYSFIHLTFQEYLCATYLATFGEVGGTQSIWDELKGDLENPRWREVVRLLVASLRSLTGQAFFVDKLIDETRLADEENATLLAIGLLRDAIEPAEVRSSDIVEKAILSLLRLTDANAIRTIEDSLGGWVSKDEKNATLTASVIEKVLGRSQVEEQTILVLIHAALALPVDGSPRLMKAHQEQKGFVRNLILSERHAVSPASHDELDSLLNFWCTYSPDTNAAGSLGLCVLGLLDQKSTIRRLLAREISMLLMAAPGPSHDHGLNLIALAKPAAQMHPMLEKAFDKALEENGGRLRDGRLASNGFARAFCLGISGYEFSDKEVPEEKLRQVVSNAVTARLKAGAVLATQSKTFIELKGALEANRSGDELRLIRKSFMEKGRHSPDAYGSMLINSDIFSKFLMPSLSHYLGLSPISHWQQALRVTLKTLSATTVAKYFDQREWAVLADRIAGPDATDEDFYFAAWLAVFDIWLWRRAIYSQPSESPLASLFVAAEKKHPVVDFSLSLRRAYLGIEEGGGAMAAALRQKNPLIEGLLKQVGVPTPEGVREAVAAENRSPSSARRPSTVVKKASRVIKG